MLSCRDNLYQVELEPSTSTELRYQRVRKKDHMGVEVQVGVGRSSSRGGGIQGGLGWEEGSEG
jgi:hypothetical protein